MTRQTVPPADKSGAEHHQIAPSTSSHAQAALGKISFTDTLNLNIFMTSTIQSNEQHKHTVIGE